VVWYTVFSSELWCICYRILFSSFLAAGGSVISTRCTETYQAKTPQLSVMGIPLWYPPNNPRTVIQVKFSILGEHIWIWIHNDNERVGLICFNWWNMNFIIFTFEYCILLRIYLSGSLWRRQSQQSFNTLTPFNFLFYSLHVSAPAGHPQVRYTISYYFCFWRTILIQRNHCTYAIWL
jgi:hypothetical protein